MKKWFLRKCFPKPSISINELSLKVRSMIMSLHTKGYSGSEICQKLNLNVSIDAMIINTCMLSIGLVRTKSTYLTKRYNCLSALASSSRLLQSDQFPANDLQSFTSNVLTSDSPISFHFPLDLRSPLVPSGCPLNSLFVARDRAS